MSGTTEQARAEMFAGVVAGLVAFPGLLMRWQGKDGHEPPENQEKYVYSSISTAREGQASLSDDTGKKKWESVGTLMVQCYAPLNKGSVDVAMSMALALKRHFRKLSTPSGVWFRNVSAKEIGMSDAWFQVNFTATFTFDEIQ